MMNGVMNHIAEYCSINATSTMSTAITTTSMTMTTTTNPSTELYLFMSAVMNQFISIACTFFCEMILLLDC